MNMSQIVSGTEKRNTPTRQSVRSLVLVRCQISQKKIHWRLLDCLHLLLVVHHFLFVSPSLSKQI